jgi:serine/threonine protein kinase
LRPALPNINEAGTLQEFPDNVTKIFYKQKDLDKIIRIAPLLPEIMGPNEGHRITPYKRRIKGRNIPDKTRRNLSVGDENDLFAVRMPYLGTTIGRVKSVQAEIRRLPILTLITQMRKVLTQVQTLVQHDYIHGDIRDVNVMIDPLTGTITIIDFDLLSRTESFGITGAYNNPPEVMNGRLTNMKKINYVNYSYTCFTHFRELYPSKYVFRASLMEAVNMNRAFKERVGGSQFLGSLMATFDSYGLACTLLILFHEIYPGSIRSSKEELKSLLSSIITNQGRPYTEGQLNACTDAMYAMIHSVLLPLASIDQEGRKKVSEVLPTVSSIEADLRTAMGSVNHVGGKGRRTRRSSKK